MDEIRYGDGFSLQRLEVGMLENNCYILRCLKSNVGVVVDPGDEAEKILEAAKGMTVKHILLTHAHWDHTGALEQIKKATAASVGVNKLDADVFRTSMDFNIEDGQEILFGECSLKVIHTPGHSPGSVCLLVGTYLLSGDTVFPGGPGSTSIPWSDSALLLRSIVEKIFTLPPETIIYPGHGLSTTVGRETGTHPYQVL